jgi:hypothetical protein
MNRKHVKKTLLVGKEQGLLDADSTTEYKDLREWLEFLIGISLNLNGIK